MQSKLLWDSSSVDQLQQECLMYSKHLPNYLSILLNYKTAFCFNTTKAGVHSLIFFTFTHILQYCKFFFSITHLFPKVINFMYFCLCLLLVEPYWGIYVCLTASQHPKSCWLHSHLTHYWGPCETLFGLTQRFSRTAVLSRACSLFLTQSQLQLEHVVGKQILQCVQF